VAGVGVAVSLGVVLGFLSATNAAAVKLIDAFVRITVPPHFMCA
jgi:ABC-type nitrate/sulfonate/bicarbonate transport system permease component